jgi:hypothetical protein
MRRTSLLLLAFLLVALASSAFAAQDGVPTERPVLRAALSACQTGATPDERFAIFTGSMPAKPGTVRMAMRFDLSERRPGGAWKRISAPQFGRWDRSQPLRAGFVWTKRVEHLRDGVEYRSAVRFRWYAARGRLQGESRRTTPSCRQPDRRADLAVESLAITPDADGRTARYAVTVVNTGQSAAGGFDVGIASATADAVRPVAGLEAGGRTTVQLAAESCSSADPVVATVDVRDAVDEADERDNAIRQLCGAR